METGLASSNVASLRDSFLCSIRCRMGVGRSKRNTLKLAIYLTQVTPTYSVRPRGGLSTGSRLVRSPVRDRRRVSRVSGPTPVAGGISVPPVPACESVAGARGAVPVCGLWTSNVRHSRHDFPGFPHGAHDVVSRHVVADESEDGCQRPGAPAHLGLAQLQDRLDLAAQTAARDGASGSRPPDRPCRGRRSLRGRRAPAPARTADGNESPRGSCGAGRETPPRPDSAATDSG